MIAKTFDITNVQIQSYPSIPSPERALFFDIETTGFQAGRAEIYLIGCAYLKDGIYHGIQWLSEGFLDEQRILKEFLAFSESFDTLIHFNGCMFDVPFVEKTAQKYGISCNLSSKNQLDLMKIARKCKHFLALSGLKQKEIEQFLGIQRDDIFSGGELIEVFEEYKRTRDIRLQKTLLLHNADDVRGMLPILDILSYYEITFGPLESSEISVKSEVIDDYVTATFQMPFSFPKEVAFLSENGCEASFSSDKISLRIPIYRQTLKSYLPHPENYYYLPEEGIVVHKKIASTVDPSHRIKATREVCYLSSPGPFVPFLKGCTLPVFRASLTDSVCYVMQKDIELFSYLRLLLNEK